MRRESDRWQARLVKFLIVINALLALMSSYIGYRAIAAIQGFDSFVERASERLEHATKRF